MSPYDAEHFLACRDCGVLQPMISHASEWADDALEDALNAYDEFLAGHRAHRTAAFDRQRSETHSDLPLWDPMAMIAFEVTDGHHTYIVSSARQSIEEPRVYRFTPGTLPMQRAAASIDDGDFRRGLDLAFHPHALRPSKVNRFMSVLHALVGQIPPDELEIAFDVADDPALSIARMPDAIYEALLDCCADIFDPWELSRIQEFLHQNRDADGLLAVLVRRSAEVRTPEPALFDASARRGSLD